MIHKPKFTKTPTPLGVCCNCSDLCTTDGRRSVRKKQRNGKKEGRKDRREERRKREWRERRK